MNIRVLIVDDHAVVAEGLRFVVDAQGDIEVVACVEDGREAVEMAVKTDPDVVLMDHAMPGLNGAEATYRSLYSADPPPASTTNGIAKNGKRAWWPRRAKRDAS